LKTLCFIVEVDYDDLSGDRKTSKARELIQFCERRGRVNDLLRALERITEP